MHNGRTAWILGRLVALFIIGCFICTLGAQQPSGDASAPHRSLVSQYCVACHDDITASGGFSWATIDVAHPELNAEQAEQVIRKVRSGMMPPVGAPRPDTVTLKAFASALESRIDQAARPHSEAPELHRVNRREYRNSVRDLLDIDIDVDALLPPDGRTGNFDNMADALTVTPALMQAYIRAADKIARQAVGDPAAAPVMAQFDVPRVRVDCIEDHPGIAARTPPGFHHRLLGCRTL